MLCHWLRTLALGLFLLILAFLLIGLLLPTQLRATISTQSGASQTCLFRHISQLDRWPLWTIWAQDFPDTVYLYEGKSGEVGSIERFSTPTQGSGSITLSSVQPESEVVYDLVMADWNYSLRGKLLIQGSERLRNVIWVTQSEPTQNPIYRWGNLIFAPMLAKDMERSLERLNMACAHTTAETPTPP